MDKIKGIARYAHISKPSAARGSDKLKYSVNILVHKSDPQCAQMTAAVNQAIQNGFPGGMPKGADTCWIDMAADNAGTPLADYMCLRASTDVAHGKPEVCDANLQPVIDPAIDSTVVGQIVWLGGNLQTYTAGSQGVKMYFNGLMVTGEMGALPKESLSSKPTAASMFGDVAGGAAPQAAGPAAPVPPSAPTPPAAPVPQARVMTPAANGATYEAMIAAGWNDELLIQHGMMTPPGGAVPAFMS